MRLLKVVTAAVAASWLVRQECRLRALQARLVTTATDFESSLSEHRATPHGIALIGDLPRLEPDDFTNELKPSERPYFGLPVHTFPSDPAAVVKTAALT